MNLKKIKILSFFAIFILSFLSHFMYDWFPCTFISFFFPVNESIWEHMKILYTSILLWGIFEYFILNKYNINYNNFVLQLFFSAFSSIIIYLIIYLPIYNFVGENLFISISLILIVYAFVIICSYYIMLKNENNIFNNLSVVCLILVYIIFIYLTYNPWHNYIFYDSLHEHYGIKNVNN